MEKSTSTRREFLHKSTAVSAGAMAFPYIVSASALGNGGNVAPSNRIVMACIGTGGKGRNNMHHFMQMKDVQVVAVCDVDDAMLNQARDQVNDHYKNKDCKKYKDFRELLNKEDTDAISIATPDHWHSLTTIAAANAGNDIYCEKPLANTVAEGRAMCDAVKKNNRILQTGSHERSSEGARKACELVRNGRIGKLHTIEINLPCSDGHHRECIEHAGPLPVMPIPEGFDYDMWVGHTPMVPYTKRRCHFWWRFILNYGGGEMTDRGAHVIDIGQLGNNTDDTGPTEIEALGWRPTYKGGIYDTFFKYQFECKYANGVRMVGGSSGERGLKFVGDKGWIFVKIHGADLKADPASLLDEKIGEDEEHLGRSPGHHRNFIECVKSRKPTLATAEIGHRTASLCHLLNISMITGKKLQWDPKKEQITNDAEANSMISRPMRDPWRL